MEIAIVYMVAGMSSRFGGKPKHFTPIGPNNETLLEYSLNQAIKANFSKIILIIRKETLEDFKKFFSDNYKGIPIQYAFQEFNPEERDKPWGTTDALCSVYNLIDCPFVVCNGDDIYGEQAFQILANHLRYNQIGATIGYKLGNVLSERGTVNRGIFELNPNQTLTSIIETFDIEESNLEAKGLTKETPCSQNIFALHPETLQHLNQALIKFKQENSGDRKKECLLPEELNRLINQNKLIIKHYLTSQKSFGITNPEDEKKVREQLKSDKNNFKIS